MSASEQSTEKAATSETYKGRRISTRVDRRQGCVWTYVNGQVLGKVYGTTTDIQRRELMVLRSWVDAADERRKTDPSAYPPHFYEGAERVDPSSSSKPEESL